MAERRADAAQDYRPGSASRAHRSVSEDRVVTAVDPLSRFAVAEREHADAGADIGFHRGVAAEWKESHRGIERNHPQLECLLDLRSIAVDHIAIHARHRTLLEPDAEAALEVVPEAD